MKQYLKNEVTLLLHKERQFNTAITHIGINVVMKNTRDSQGF